MDSQEPCSACGWTAESQERCSYASHVKLFYGAGSRGAWAIGSDFILKERPYKTPDQEALTIKFLKDNTTIPVPTIIKGWVDENGSQFKLIERIKGETLEEAWPTLSQKEKDQIADETAKYLLQLRNFHSLEMHSIGEKPLYSGWLFGDGNEIPHGPFDSDTSLWNDMAISLSRLPEASRLALQKRLPLCAPYTLTHGDLTSCNIIVKNGHLAGIIDWETAGYFPVWWEWVCAGIAYSEDDMAWKNMLRARMGDFSREREFWRDIHALWGYPDMGQRGTALLKELLEE